MHRAKTNTNLSDDQLLLIGAISVLWARLEFSSGLLISGLDGRIEEDIAEIVGWPMGRKADCLKSRLASLSLSDRQKMIPLVELLDQTIGDRNLLNHGFLVFETPNLEKPRLLSWRRKSPEKPITTAWLETLESDVDHLSLKFLAFCEKEGFLAKIEGKELFG